jgi:hypothetical protein
MFREAQKKWLGQIKRYSTAYIIPVTRLQKAAWQQVEE